jgi:hypothetical protein
LFAVAFVLHLILWRISLPERQTKALVNIFYGTFLIWCLVSWGFLRWDSEWAQYFPFYLSEYAHIFLYYCTTVFVYIGGYSLLEADSPSLLIIDRIHTAGPEGMDKDSLYASLGDDVLVVPRVNDLLRDEMAVLENGRYKITPKGTFMICILLLHRRIMKAEHKGG